MKDLEIKQEGDLLSSNGSLKVYGWARYPYLHPNEENIRIYRLGIFQKFRVKKWHYYAIITNESFFSFTITHLGYLGLVFAYTVDFKSLKYHEETITIPFGRGIILPRNSLEGIAKFEKDGVKVIFETKDDNMRFINVDWPKFGKLGLKANLKISLLENHESIVNVFPFKDNRFFYTRKINCMKPEGEIYYDRAYRITPDNAFATLDWGFGVWPYKTSWIWGSFSTKLNDGRILGINLGDKIGNNPEVTDNAVILDGKVIKLPKVFFDYDSRDLKKPWRITSEDGKLRITFAPFFVRLAKTDFILLKSVLYQIFGYYSGVIELESGEKINLSNVVGWIEEHNANW